MPLQIPQRFQPQIQSALEKAVNSNDMDFLNRLQGGGIAGEMSYDAQMSMPGTLPYAQQARGNYTPTSLTAMSGIPIASDVAGLKMDYEMFRDEPESRTPLNFGLSALGALPFLPPLAGVGATVWHGSPHRWDKPDLSKIGTGEGAQAYGHGFYSAENKQVGQQYKDDLSGFDELAIKTNSDMKIGNELDDIDLDVAKYLEMGARDAGQFPHNTVYYAKRLAKDKPDVLKRMDEYGDSARVGYERNQGHLYKLDIDDSVVDRMLDWDAPLSEQRDILRKLRSLGNSDRPRDVSIYGRIQDALQPFELGSTSGETIYHMLSNTPKGKEAASRYLSDLDIPGVKYFDGSSRAAGEGTRNFVNFNADDITAISRNGEPIHALDKQEWYRGVSGEHDLRPYSMWTTDPVEASHYAEGAALTNTGDSANVIPAYMDSGKGKNIDDDIIEAIMEGDDPDIVARSIIDDLGLDYAEFHHPSAESELDHLVRVVRDPKKVKYRFDR